MSFDSYCGGYRSGACLKHNQGAVSGGIDRGIDYQKLRNTKMKTRNLIGCLLTSMVLASTVQAQGSKPVGAEQAAVAQEQKWLQSQKTNNTDLLAPLLADKVVDTNTEGKFLVGKAAVIADAKAVKWMSAEYTNVKASVYGDTVIVTGIFNGKGTDAAGKPVDVHERYTDTWVKMADGQWQCVATHGSSIKM